MCECVCACVCVWCVCVFVCLFNFVCLFVVLQARSAPPLFFGPKDNARS